jgi:hypothetical protein
MRHNMLKNRFVVLNALRGALQMPGWKAWSLSPKLKPCAQPIGAKTQLSSG